MKLVSHKQLIDLTYMLEQDTKFIKFPVKLFTNCFYTIFFYSFFMGLFAYNILYSVSLFILLFMSYYTFLFANLWKLYRLSIIKLLTFQLVCCSFVIFLGFISQKPLILLLKYIFSLYSSVFN